MLPGLGKYSRNGTRGQKHPPRKYIYLGIYLHSTHSNQLVNRQVEIQPVFNTDVLTTLQDQAATFLQDLEMKLKSSDGEHEEVYLECPPQVVGFLEMNQPGMYYFYRH